MTTKAPNPFEKNGKWTVEGFDDLTNLFLRLQGELEPIGIGTKTSLEAQLRIVEAELRHLFVNAENLSSGLGTGGLTYEHAFLKKTGQWSRQYLSTLLAEYRSAQKTNQTQLFAELADFQPQLDKAYRHVVTIAELEANKASLKTSVFAKSCLRDMGDLIESSLFPFARLRLKVLEADKKFTAKNRRIEELTLGAVLAELSRFDSALYNPEPFGVSLSQWRNISHHSSFRVTGNTVYCEYGMKSHRQKFECSPDQLIQVFSYVDSVNYLHKVAFEIFCTDNIHKLQEALEELRETLEPTSTPSELSDFTTDATLAYSILACGFRVLNAGRKGSKWALVLHDRHDRREDDIKIALHEALIPYLLHKGPTEVNSWIESQRERHFISFRGEIRSSAELTGNEYSPFKIGKNFRIERSLGDNEGQAEKDY